MKGGEGDAAGLAISDCAPGSAASRRPTGTRRTSAAGTSDISEIDDAINNISAMRAQYGAVQNRQRPQSVLTLLRG
jgi:flagellin-like hook-associated protein FlgL